MRAGRPASTVTVRSLAVAHDRELEPVAGVGAVDGVDHLVHRADPAAVDLGDDVAAEAEPAPSIVAGVLPPWIPASSAGPRRRLDLTSTPARPAG